MSDAEKIEQADSAGQVLKSKHDGVSREETHRRG